MLTKRYAPLDLWDLTPFFSKNGVKESPDERIKIHQFCSSEVRQNRSPIFSINAFDRTELDKIGSWENGNYLKILSDINAKKDYIVPPVSIIEIESGISISKNDRHRRVLALGKDHYISPLDPKGFFSHLKEKNIGEREDGDIIAINDSFKPDFHINGTVFLAQGHRNISLWLLSLASILLLRDYAQHLIGKGPFYIVVKHNSPESLFVVDALCRSGFPSYDNSNIIDLSSQKSFSCDRLLIPSFLYSGYHMTPGILFEKLSEEFRQKIAVANKRGRYFRQGARDTVGGFSNMPKKIFVSRADSGRRRVENEEEINRQLRKAGYQIVCPGDFSPHQQAQIFSEATHIIGQHGMGMTNLFFSPSQAKVAEIFTPFLYRPTYRALANLRQMPYGYFCFSPQREPMDKGDVYIPPTLFFETLEEHDFL